MSLTRREILGQVEAAACAEIAPIIPVALLPELARTARAHRVNPADPTTLGFLLENPGSGSQARMFAPFAAKYRAAYNRIKSGRSVEFMAVEAADQAEIAASRALSARQRAAAENAEASFTGKRWEVVRGPVNGYGIEETESRETAEFRAHIADAVAAA